MENTHDSNYVIYLQQMFGKTGIAFLGAIISIMGLVIMCLLVGFNAAIVYIQKEQNLFTANNNNADNISKYTNNKAFLL